MYKLLLLGAILPTIAFADSTPFSCTSISGNPNIVRVEGVTELVGDIIYQCTGGTPTQAGQAIPASDIRITLNTSVTNRLFNATLTDALVMIDEPFPPDAQKIPSNVFTPALEVPQILCAPGGIAGVPCPEIGVGTGSPTGYGMTLNPYSNQANIFQGTLVGDKSILWASVPIDPPGQGASRYIRITGIRVNAAALGLSGLPIPNAVTASITITGPGAPTLDVQQQTNSYIQQGETPAISTTAALPQCLAHNTSLIGGSAATGFDFTVNVSEVFAAALLRRNVALTADGPTSPTPAAQNVPGNPYNTLSGIYAPLLFTANPTVGLADSGTRIRVSMTNLSPGTRIFVPTTVALPGGSSGFNPLPGISVNELQLVSTDQFGVSPPGYVAVPATASLNGTPVGEMSYSGTSAYAVYEVVNSDPNAVESIHIPVAVVYDTSPQTPIGLGQAMVHVDLVPNGGPVASIIAADATAPIPRYITNIPNTFGAYSIQGCGPGLSGVNPPNNATNIPQPGVTLQWGAALVPSTYDVYFGLYPYYSLVASGVTGTSYSVGPLRPSTTYYWKVVANNAYGSTSTPDLIFSTVSPDLAITQYANPLFIGDNPAFTYTLTVTNVTGYQTTGTVTVVVSLSNGLRAVDMGGGGDWVCTLASLTCTWQAGPTNGPLPLMYVWAVMAGPTPPQVTSVATVSVAGDLNLSNNTASVTENVNPIFNSTFFVDQLYQDLLNRGTDNTGGAYWTGLLNSGLMTRTQVAIAFFTSPEFAEGGLEIIKDYIAVLGRDPDYGGWRNWFTAWQQGSSLLDILNAFVSSPEFQNTYGQLSNSDFVSLLYHNVLGRPADAGGLTYWTGYLDTDQLTRAQLVADFVSSPEFDTLVRARAYANLLYMGFLRRGGDPGGIQYWTGLLSDQNNLPAVISSFLVSTEYLSRF